MDFGSLSTRGSLVLGMVGFAGGFTAASPRGGVELWSLCQMAVLASFTSPAITSQDRRITTLEPNFTRKALIRVKC